MGEIGGDFSPPQSADADSSLYIPKGTGFASQTALRGKGFGAAEAAPMLTAFLFSYYYNIPSREGLDGDIRAGEGGADGLLGRGADIHADKRVDIRKL